MFTQESIRISHCRLVPLRIGNFHGTDGDMLIWFITSLTTSVFQD